MTHSHFVAYLSKMKHVRRWGLMRNTLSENVQEHTLQVAVVAHMLAVIRNRRFGGDIDPERVALLALYHDAPEVITGDLPTPVKYFNPQIEEAYGELETVASRKLLGMLPDDLREEFEPLLLPADHDADLWKLVKAADRLCAHLKCVEELKAGNHEFERAAEATRKKLDESDVPEVADFMATFGDSFSLTLDELN